MKNLDPTRLLAARYTLDAIEEAEAQRAKVRTRPVALDIVDRGLVTLHEIAVEQNLDLSKRATRLGMGEAAKLYAKRYAKAERLAKVIRENLDRRTV